jgi:hypothetical protein
MAEESGVIFLDAGTIITSGDDSIHLAQEEHRKLAETVMKIVKQNL